MLSKEKPEIVIVGTPDHWHPLQTIAAGQAGAHVYVEKPISHTILEGRAMVNAARAAERVVQVGTHRRVSPHNVSGREFIRSGKLGNLRLFSSVFTMQVREGDIRLQKELGGGTLYDIGVYCINAARYLFRDNPTFVSAFAVQGEDRRFKEVDEMTAALLAGAASEVQSEEGPMYPVLLPKVHAFFSQGLRFRRRPPAGREKPPHKSFQPAQGPF